MRGRAGKDEPRAAWWWVVAGVGVVGVVMASPVFFHWLASWAPYSEESSRQIGAGARGRCRGRRGPAVARTADRSTGGNYRRPPNFGAVIGRNCESTWPSLPCTTAFIYPTLTSRVSSCAGNCSIMRRSTEPTSVAPIFLTRRSRTPSCGEQSSMAPPSLERASPALTSTARASAQPDRVQYRRPRRRPHRSELRASESVQRRFSRNRGTLTRRTSPGRRPMSPRTGPRGSGRPSNAKPPSGAGPEGGVVLPWSWRASARGPRGGRGRTPPPRAGRAAMASRPPAPTAERPSRTSAPDRPASGTARTSRPGWPATGPPSTMSRSRRPTLQVRGERLGPGGHLAVLASRACIRKAWT